jgi:hypothetical protein
MEQTIQAKADQNFIFFLPAEAGNSINEIKNGTLPARLASFKMNDQYQYWEIIGSNGNIYGNLFFYLPNIQAQLTDLTKTEQTTKYQL